MVMSFLGRTVGPTSRTVSETRRRGAEPEGGGRRERMRFWLFPMVRSSCSSSEIVAASLSAGGQADPPGIGMSGFSSVGGPGQQNNITYGYTNIARAIISGYNATRKTC